MDDNDEVSPSLLHRLHHTDTKIKPKYSHIHARRKQKLLRSNNDDPDAAAALVVSGTDDEDDSLQITSLLGPTERQVHSSPVPQRHRQQNRLQVVQHWALPSARGMFEPVLVGKHGWRVIRKL